MSKVDDWNAARLGRATCRHPFTGMGSSSTACAICVHPESHEVHSGAEVVNLAQFRSRRRGTV